MSFWPSARSTRLDIGQVLFCVFIERDQVKVNKNAKKKPRPISSHLDRSSLVTKGFIIWPKRKLFLAEPTREIPSGQDGSILQNFTFNWNSLTNLANIEMTFYIRHFSHAWTSISPVHSTFQCDIRELQTWVLPPPALPRWQSPVPENHNVTYSSLPRHFLHSHFEHGNALADDVIGLCHLCNRISLNNV